MKSFRHILLLSAMLLLGCTTTDGEENIRKAASTMTMNITIGNSTVTVLLEDNSSAQALYEALQQSSITYEAHDYGGFEKVGALGRSFPQNNQSITTEPGDIILYQGNNLCIYYDTNPWSFTRIGKIVGATQQSVKDFVRAGEGNVTVTLSVGDATPVRTVEAPAAHHDDYISLGGVRQQQPSKGVYIKGGKKMLGGKR